MALACFSDKWSVGEDIELLVTDRGSTLGDAERILNFCVQKPTLWWNNIAMERSTIVNNQNAGAMASYRRLIINCPMKSCEIVIMK